MQNKIFKHLLSLFFVLLLLSIFAIHWSSAEKIKLTENAKAEEKRKADLYLKNFGVPPEYPKEKQENKTAENNK